jgi:hypothetical protein
VADPIPVPRSGTGRVGRGHPDVPRSYSERLQLVGKPGPNKWLDEVVLGARIQIRQFVALGGARGQQ